MYTSVWKLWQLQSKCCGCLGATQVPEIDFLDESGESHVFIYSGRRIWSSLNFPQISACFTPKCWPKENVVVPPLSMWAFPRRKGEKKTLSLELLWPSAFARGHQRALRYFETPGLVGWCVFSSVRKCLASLALTMNRLKAICKCTWRLWRRRLRHYAGCFLQASQGGRWMGALHLMTHASHIDPIPRRQDTCTLHSSPHYASALLTR